MKEEYRFMDAIAIKECRLNGEDIYEPNYDTIEMVYTGDTVMRGLLDPRNDFVFKAPILITELTYLEGDRSKAEGIFIITYHHHHHHHHHHYDQ